MLRSDFALTENFADQNDENECDVTEASYSGFREVVITAEGRVITVRCGVRTLYVDVHDFFKSNSSAKAVVSKVRNSTEKTHQHNTRKLFKHKNKPLSRLDCETRWGLTFLMQESRLLVRDLLGQIAMANEFLLLSDVDWFAG